MIRVDLTYNVVEPSIIRVGNGSGNLLITQASTGAVSGDTILIRAGTYSINIEDIDAGEGGRIFIKNEGVVNVESTTRLKNLVNVTYSGDYVNGLTTGIRYQNIAGRGIQAEGIFNGVYIENILFKNLLEFCIASHFSIFERPYDGTAASRCSDLKFRNLELDNCGGILWRGELNSVGETPYDIGMLKGLEISGCYVHDCPDIGSAISFGNVEDYNIHHNVFKNINSMTNNHNGVCYMTGNGDFHHNYLREYQGNAIRGWVFSRGDVPKEVNYYNNICSRSRKYSALEFQSFERLLWAGKTTTAVCNCYHNTAHQMHYEDNSGTTGNYYGVILDVYGMFGSEVSAWNNAGIDFPYPNGSDFIFNGAVDNPYPGTNRYYATFELAKVTDVEFLVLAGSPLTTGDYRENPEPIDDYYDNPRAGRPTIGAVQYIP